MGYVVNCSKKICFLGHQVEIDHFNKFQSVLTFKPEGLKRQFSFNSATCTMFYESANYNTIIQHIIFKLLRWKYQKITEIMVFRAKYFYFSMYFQLAPCISKIRIVVKIKSNNCQWTQLTCIPKNGPVCITKLHQLFFLEVIFTLSKKHIKNFGLKKTHCI